MERPAADAVDDAAPADRAAAWDAYSKAVAVYDAAYAAVLLMTQ